MPINVENMRKWVKALRSKEYAQGRQALRTDNNKFCCLGVACDISKVGQWIKRNGNGLADVGTEWEYWQPDFETSWSVLPIDVADWLGLSVDPTLEFEGSQDNCTTLNDTRKLTFAQIADAIEFTYPEVKEQSNTV